MSTDLKVPINNFLNYIIINLGYPFLPSLAHTQLNFCQRCRSDTHCDLAVVVPSARRRPPSRTWLTMANLSSDKLCLWAMAYCLSREHDLI